LELEDGSAQLILQLEPVQSHMFLTHSLHAKDDHALPTADLTARRKVILTLNLTALDHSRLRRWHGLIIELNPYQLVLEKLIDQRTAVVANAWQQKARRADDGQLGRGDGLAHAVDGDALDEAGVVRLEVLDDEQGAVGLVLYADALQRQP
jgi:hypothetical protein